MLFSRRSASDKKAGRSALFSLQVGESRLGGGSHLFVAVIGQTFERSDRRRCRGEAQSFDCDRAQARGLSAEQASARLGKFDERLNRRGTADAAQRQDQLALDPFILLFF